MMFDDESFYLHHLGKTLYLNGLFIRQGLRIDPGIYKSRKPLKGVKSTGLNDISSV
jgi:hypothetical protein